MVYLTGHWNWNGLEGKDIDILAYTNCDSVELFLNGKSLGAKEYDFVACSHLTWQVPYCAGELKAIGYKGGKVKISHCFNEENGLKLKEMIENKI